MASNIGTLSVKFTGDTKEFDRAISRTQAKLNKFSSKMRTVGKSLTKYVTLPILAIGAVMIKSASDAAETESKFKTVFSHIGTKAQDMAKVLQKSYIMSREESQKLLSNTGDLLTGFGFTQNAAADLSFEVQKLAADLASFNNIKTEDASRALTKGLLGEREGMKMLGIAIRESDVKQKLFEKGQQDLTGTSLLAAKAQATFELALQQSGNALGDTGRTAGSFANQMKQFRADVADLSVELGNKLLPFAKKLLAGAIKLIDKFKALNDETKTSIVKWGLLLAAAGPVLIMFGNLARVISLMGKSSMKLLAIVIALAAAFILVKNAAKDEDSALNKWLKERWSYAKSVGARLKAYGKAAADILAKFSDPLNIFTPGTDLWKEHQDAAAKYRKEMMDTLDYESRARNGNLKLTKAEAAEYKKLTKLVQEYESSTHSTPEQDAAYSAAVKRLKQLEKLQANINFEASDMLDEVSKGFGDFFKSIFSGFDEVFKLFDDLGNTITAPKPLIITAEMEWNNPYLGEEGDMMQGKNINGPTGKPKFTFNTRQGFVDTITQKSLVAQSAIADVNKQLLQQLVIADQLNQPFDEVGQSLQSYTQLYQQLISQGISPANEKMRELSATIRELNASNDENIKTMIKQQDQAYEMGQVYQMAIGSMTSGFIDVINGQKSMADVMKQTIAEIINMLLAQTLAQSIANATQSAGATGPGAVFTMPVFIAGAMALVGGLFTGLLSSFATGGMVTGPTLAMVGDNPSGKEAIIPFERMGEFISGVTSNSSTNNIVVDSYIRGEDILLTSNRANQKRNQLY